MTTEQQLCDLVALVPRAYEWFRGVHPADCAIEMRENEFCFINTSPAGSPGQHWTLLSRCPDWQLFCSLGSRPFDGLPPEAYIVRRPLQSPTSGTCGIWVVYVAVHLQYSKIADIVRQFDGMSPTEADQYVVRYVRSLI